MICVAVLVFPDVFSVYFSSSFVSVETKCKFKLVHMAARNGIRMHELVGITVLATTENTFCQNVFPLFQAVFRETVQEKIKVRSHTFYLWLLLLLLLILLFWLQRQLVDISFYVSSTFHAVPHKVLLHSLSSYGLSV